MDALLQWASQRDWRKLLLFAPVALLIMNLGAIVITVADSWIVIVGFGGMVVCGMFGYWLGNGGLSAELWRRRRSARHPARSPGRPQPDRDPGGAALRASGQRPHAEKEAQRR
jgi:hypothetical protein